MIKKNTYLLDEQLDEFAERKGTRETSQKIETLSASPTQG